jgi:hypothetical protein
VLATKNCFGQMQLLSERMTEKAAPTDQRVHAFSNKFFAAISVIKVQCTRYRVKQQIFLQVTFLS